MFRSSLEALRAVLVTTVFISLPANAAVLYIDFEGLTGTPFAALDSHGQIVITGGFEFITDAGLGGFASWNDLASNNTGSTALFANQTEANLSVNEVGGGEFSIYSIDLAFSNLAQTGNAELVFTGVYADASTVEQSFLIDGILQTYNFTSEFVGIVNLRWSQSQAANNNHQFDNLVLNTDALPAELFKDGFEQP